MKQIVIDNISTNYYITEDGRCFNNKTGKYLKGQVGENGYLSYNLTVEKGKRKRCYSHRLVAAAYLSSSLDKKKNQINHKDGNKLNNHFTNLEWVTAKENQEYAIQCGLRKFNHIYCFTKDKQLVAEYLSVAAAAHAVGISRSIILQELDKEKKSLSGGFYWSKEPKLEKVKNYKNIGKAKVVNQYDLNYRFITSYPSVGTAARALGLSNGSHISECCRGRIKTYKGFIWRYFDDIVLTSNES